MFTKIFFAAIAAQALFVVADPTPSLPGPGDSYNEGSDCQIEWTADDTKTWTDMTISLKTGNNWNMVFLEDVVTGVDATTVTSHTYPCPQVTPNSAIYFYEFTNPGVNGTYWTTRFTIADASGASTPPSETVQPSGDKIPWGTGALVGSGGNSSSSDLTSSSSSLSSPSSSSSSSSISAPILPSSSSTPVPSGSKSSSSGVHPSSTGNSLAGNSTTTGDNSGAITVGSHVAGVVAALTAAAFALMY